MILYGLLSLLIIRPLSTAIGLVGEGLAWPTTLFLGWFGPRGIASIIIAAIVVKDAGLDKNDEITFIASIAVVLSVYLHGVTAAPGASTYARWSEARSAERAGANRR